MIGQGGHAVTAYALFAKTLLLEGFCKNKLQFLSERCRWCP